MTNLIAYAGIPLSEFVALTEDDGTEYQYSLRTFEGQIRSYSDNSLTATITVTGGTDDCGNAGVYLTAFAATMNMTAGIYAYDILPTLTSTGAHEPPIFGGDIVIMASRTTP